MKSINTLSTKATYFVVFALLASLFSFSPAQALSCLNPTDMIERYVSEEQFSIALVTAGKLETVGDTHNQVVTVKENLKGTTDTSVSFSYDDTWQYFCAGQPAKAGTDAVYVTSEGLVTQVVTLNTPLYDSLMTALDNTPVVANPPSVDTTKRTLMQRIIDLLQQVVSLLTGESKTPTIEPEPIVSPETLIGMTTSEAKVYAEEHDIVFRIVEIDGESQATTKDFRPGRINASVEQDVVVSYTVEGEEAGLHDEILNMTQSEAEAYAEARNIAFRIGRIDDEYLAVTMDYRPGRITAEIEDGVIVDYSVE